MISKNYQLCLKLLSKLKKTFSFAYCRKTAINLLTGTLKQQSNGLLYKNWYTGC